MKTHIKFFCCIFIAIIIKTEISAQSKINDYISLQYYQKVAQAELFWLEENYKDCYRILSELDTTCTLLNGAWSELYHFAELSLMYKNYNRAYECIHSLITNYGFSVDDFEYMQNFRQLKKINNWNSLKTELLNLEKHFTSDTTLYIEISEMLEADQYYRKNGYYRIKELIKQDSMSNDSLAQTSLMHSPYMVIVDSIDNVNFKKLLNIMDTKGFPLSSSIKYNIKERQKIYTALFVMLVHFSDSIQANYLKPILLQYIKHGDCPPELLANMIDRYQLNKSQLFLYGVFNNISSDQIFEYEKLDERRKSIGLPDYDLSKRILSKKATLKENFNRKK